LVNWLLLILTINNNLILTKMKKLSLNDFAKANVTLEKKGMMSVMGGNEEPKKIVVESSSLGRVISNLTQLK
jgi:hypothetical protein